MPTSKKQSDLIREPLPRMTIIDGCISSGKTFSCNHKAIEHITNNYKNKGLIFFCGRTLSTLETNVLEPLATQYDKYFTYSINQKKANFCGIRIDLRGCDNMTSETKIRGSTAEFVYGDELTLWNKPFLLRCMGSLRTDNACFLGTTNPDTPNNFVWTDYLEEERRKELGVRRLTFDMDDNPSLTDEYKRQISLEHTGVFHDRFIKGLWVRAEGAIYSKFANNSNSYISTPPPASSIKLLCFGTDWGHSKSANVCIAVGVSENFKTVHVLDEFYTKDELAPDELYARLTQFLSNVSKIYGAGYNYCDSAEPMLVRGLSNATKSRGIQISTRLCVKHSIISRISIVSTLISQGRFFVSPNCVNLIDALKDAVWNDKDERLDNGTTDIDSLDALEYSMCTIMDKLDIAHYLKFGGGKFVKSRTFKNIT